MPLLLAFVLSVGGQTRTVKAEQVRHVDLISNDILYEPVSRRIYASVPGRAGPGGNSIVPIDPESARVGEPILVGSEPGGMVASDDGKYLYVALDIGEIRRVDLVSKKADIQFPAGGPRQIAVVPGRRDLLVVSRGGPVGLGAGVAIFDKGVMRPNGGNPNTFALSFGPRLFTYQNQVTSWDFCAYDIGTDGLIGRGCTGGFLSGNLAILGDGNGRIYTDNGLVLDPETWRVLGRLPVPGLGHRPVPDPRSGKVLYLQGNRIIMADYRTFVTLDTIEVPGVEGGTGSLVRWGDDGIAFRTDRRIYIARTRHLGAPIPPADLGVTVKHLPEKVTVGRSVTFTLTVTNAGPGRATGVLLTHSLPPGLQFVSAEPAQSTSVLHNRVTSTEIGELKPRQRVTVTLTLTPVGNQKFETVAVVRGDQSDNQPANNTANHELDNTEAVKPSGKSIDRTEGHDGRLRNPARLEGAPVKRTRSVK